jgi:cell division initiation protein
MKIGPVDIRTHTFSKRMRGVDEGEVRAFLDMVADRLEESILEGEELRVRIDRLEAEIREFRALERTMRESLLSAERLVDERTAQSEKEAQIVIKSAEVQADKLLAKARDDLMRLRAQVDDLRRQRITYIERFRALLRSQAKILEASVETLDPEAEFAGPRPEERRIVAPSAPPAPPAPPAAAASPAPAPPGPPGLPPGGAARGPIPPYAGLPTLGPEGELYPADRPADASGGAHA